jgi:hypothetical protein
MKKTPLFITLMVFIVLCIHTPVQGQNTTVKKGAKYDTIIVKHQKPVTKKPAAKPVLPPPAVKEIVLPVPEFINQPMH